MKVSCSNTELKRCSDTDRRWNRNEDARSSPEKLLSFVTKITQELQSWQAEGTKILNGNRLKDKIGCQVIIIILNIIITLASIAGKQPSKSFVELYVF